MARLDAAEGDDPAPARGGALRPRHAGRPRQSARRPHDVPLSDNRYTLYTIYSTSDPDSIGTGVTSGCTGLLSQDMLDLYPRTPVKTKVVMLPA